MKIKKILEEDYHLYFPDKVLETIDKYLQLLLNAPLNLTSINDYAEAVHKHVADVLVPIDQINGSVLDVGTGAGIPGLIIAIVFPVTVTLLDSSEKKVAWLRKTIEKLGVLNVDTVVARAEDLARNLVEKFDFVTARAVAELRILLELCAPFCKIGGQLYFYKGPNWKTEYEVSKNAERILNVRLKDVVKYKLASGEQRALLIFEKIGSTDQKFPRKYNQILKKPL